ncbi:MAG: alpha/beta hydrolase [Mycobacteriaceae bacterium]
MRLSEIDAWDTAALAATAEALSGHITTVQEAQDQLNILGRLPGFTGAAAAAARHKYQVSLGDLRDEAAMIGAVRQLADQTADAVTFVKTRLAQLRAEAGTTFHIDDVGAVRLNATANTNPEQLEITRAGLETDVRALLAEADDIARDGAEVLTKVAQGQVTAGSAETVEQAAVIAAERNGLTAPFPPEQATATQVCSWWESLPPTQQQELIQRHPDVIGNRDGVPAEARNNANIVRLERDHVNLSRELADPNISDARRSKVQGEVKTIEAITHSVEGKPDRYVMVYDLTSGDIPHAAVAVGNPDTAQHVSITTPGMGTPVSGSLGGMVDEAQALKKETERQMNIVGRNSESVSTIAWIGYDCPPKPTFVDRDLTVGGAERAEESAARLADFYRGLAATSTVSDADVTAVGHSYGSLTTSLALQDLADDAGHSVHAPVDNAVFYGSPGLKANDESDLGLANRHGFVMRADDDPIKIAQGHTPAFHLGNNSIPALDIPIPDGVHPFGPDPRESDLEQLSVRDALTPDGVQRQGAHGHSEYPRNGDNGQLRTSGYNIAIVVAGLADTPGKLVR